MRPSTQYIIDMHGRRIYKNHVCHVCRPCRYYLYADSLERHRRERHPKAHERIEARRMQAARQQAARAAKHKDLCSDVVKTALAFYRYMREPAPQEPSDLKSEIPKAFGRACKALEKFETEGK